MSEGMRRELEEALDTFEGYVADDQARQEFIESYPDERERADMANRIYSLCPMLSEFALAVWPGRLGA